MRHTQPKMAGVALYCLMKNSAIWREMPALEGFRSTVVRCDRCHIESRRRFDIKKDEKQFVLSCQQPSFASFAQGTLTRLGLLSLKVYAAKAGQ